MQKAGANDGWHLKGSAMRFWQARCMGRSSTFNICYTCLQSICS